MARNNNFPLALNRDLLQESGAIFDKFYQKVRSILNSAEKDSHIAALSDSPYDQVVKCFVQGVAEKKATNHKMMVKKTTRFKKKKSGKFVPVDECYFCKEKGHWKRNCPKYLAVKKKTGVSSSGILDIHVIDVFLTRT